MSIQRVTKNAVLSLLDNPLRTTNASEYLAWKGRQAILEVVVAGNKSQADARSFKYSLLGPRDLDPVLIPPAQQRDQDLAYKPIAVLLSILLQKNVVSLLM